MRNVMHRIALGLTLAAFGLVAGSAIAGAPCQIAYLGGSAAQPVTAALKVIHGAPVLTVTDSAATPGIIDLELTTVPRPEIEKMSSIGIRIGRSSARAG